MFPGEAIAQKPQSDLDGWLEKNTPLMGGRSVLLIYKDSAHLYHHSVNDMNGRQKMVIRMLAMRQGKEADLEDFTPSTRVPFASCSKWLSAALVMTFVDEGKLQLSDTVGKYLPILSAHGKGYITLEQCLAHLTGIQAPPLGESLRDMRQVHSMEEAIAEIANMPMEGKPGKVFHYSNVGLQIAGAVLEKVSGRSFEALFQERIARPLGMNHTDFGKGPVALPAGGAISTAEDYMKFLEMILHRGVMGGRRILSEKSIAEMQRNRLDSSVSIAYSPAETGHFGYALGEWVMDPETSEVGKASVTSPGLFGSFPWVDPVRGYCGILVTYNLHSKGRQERYLALKALADQLY